MSAVGMGNAIRIVAASDRFAMPRVESPRTMTELRFKDERRVSGRSIDAGADVNVS